MPKITELPLKATLSVDDYMAISNESASYKNPIGKVLNDMAEVNSQINDSQDRRIHLLEEASIGKLYSQETITSYSNDVSIPSGALSLSTLDMLGGMSRKGKNILKPTISVGPHSQGGFTFTLKDNGTVDISGTFSSAVFYTLASSFPCSSNTSYTLSGGYSSSVRLRIREFDREGGSSLAEYFDQGLGVTFTTKANTTLFNVQIVIYAQPSSTITLYPMVRLSTETDSTYEPYTLNLIDGKVDEIDIVGKNLFDGNYVNAFIGGIDGRTFTLGGTNVRTTIVKVKPNTTYYIKKYDNGGGTGTRFTIACSNHLLNDMESFDQNGILFNIATAIEKNVTTLFDTKYLYVYYTNDIANIPLLQIEENSVATPYEPYSLITKPIPSQVLSLPNYGIGVNNDVYNYLEFKDGKVLYHERVKKYNIDNFTYFNGPSTGGLHYLNWDNGESKINGKALSTLPQDNQNAWYSTTPCVQMAINANRIRIYGTFTSKADFQSQYPNFELYYELATETITDVTDLFPLNFNELEVEANGHINFHYDNDYKVDIPNTISYLIDIQGALNG